MKMQVKDLTRVICPTMPIRVRREVTQFITVCSLFFNGECMLPKPVMEMEVDYVSLCTFEDGVKGLLIKVK